MILIRSCNGWLSALQSITFSVSHAHTGRNGASPVSSFVKLPSGTSALMPASEQIKDDGDDLVKLGRPSFL